MGFFSGIGNFLGNIFHPQPQPQPQSRPQPNLGQFLGQVFNQAPRPQVRVANTNRPLLTPQQVQPIIHVAADIGNQAAGDVNHLAHVISYPIKVKQYQDMAARGQISQATASQLMNQAGNDAGFGINDSPRRVMRKVGGAIAGPVASVLSGGTLPEVAGIIKGGKIAKGIVGGAAAGAGFGAINLANQQGHITPGDVATNLGEGGLIGGAAGGLIPGAKALISRMVGRGGKAAEAQVVKQAARAEGKIGAKAGTSDAPATARVKVKPGTAVHGPGVAPTGPATMATKAVPTTSGDPALDGFFSDRAGVDLGTRATEMEATQIAGQRGAAKARLLGTPEEDAKAAKQAMANARKAPAPYQLPAAHTVSDAVRNMDTAQQLIDNHTRAISTAADRLLGKSPEMANLLAHAAEATPAQVEKLATQSGKPTEFKAILDAHKGLTDFIHSARSGVGAPVNYIPKYVQHQWDLTDPAKAAEFASLQQQRGRAANERVFKTIAEGEKAGFTLKPQSAKDMINSYGSNESSAVSKQALIQGLQRAKPGHIVDVTSGEGSLRQNGKAFQQLNHPGLENYHVSPEVASQLKGVIRPNITNPVAKVADTINTSLKQISLGLGGFHDFNETLRYAGQELASLRPGGVINLLKARESFLSPQAFEKTMAGWHDNGWLDAAAKANLSGTQGLDIKGMGGFSVEKFNPLNKALFDREIRVYKMATFVDEMKKLGVQSGNMSSEQLDQARKIAAQVNNWYGGINLKVINRSPIVQQALRFLTLAPDFTEGKIRTLGNAATKWGKANPQGALARRQLVGNAVATAITASVATVATGGDPQNFFSQLIDPQAKLPYTSPTGKDLVAKLPAGPIADVKRAVSDPIHFMQSHLAAVPSTLGSAMSGKDYYDNPLVDPFQNPTPSFGDNLLGAIKSKVPIALGQGGKYLSNTQNLPTTLINTLGARVGNDQGSPESQATTSYFNTRDQFVKSLNPNDQAIFNQINPIKKDSSGNPVYTSNSLSSPSDYATLLGNPEFLTKYQAYQQSQDSHDPLWDLPTNQLRAYMNAQVISKFDPGGDKTTVKELRKQVPDSLTGQRNSYFASIPSNTAGQPTSTQAQAPSMPADVSSWYDQYKTLPSGTGARSAALKTAMGQKFLAFMQQSDNFTNQQRADLGLPPLPSQGSSSPSYVSSTGYKYTPKSSGGSSSGSSSRGGRRLKAGSVAAGRARAKLSAKIAAPKVHIPKVKTTHLSLAKISGRKSRSNKA